TGGNVVTITDGIGTAPNSIAIDAEGSTAYVTNSGSQSVSVLSIDQRAVVAPIPVGDNPISVAISPNGEFAYVTDFDSMDIKVIDTSSNTVVDEVSLVSAADGFSHPTHLSFTTD